MRSFVGYVPLTQKRDVSGLGSKSLPIRTSLLFLFLFLSSFPFPEAAALFYSILLKSCGVLTAPIISIWESVPRAQVQLAY